MKVLQSFSQHYRTVGSIVQRSTRVHGKWRLETSLRRGFAVSANHLVFSDMLVSVAPVPWQLMGQRGFWKADLSLGNSLEERPGREAQREGERNDLSITGLKVPLHCRAQFPESLAPNIPPWWRSGGSRHCQRQLPGLLFRSWTSKTIHASQPLRRVTWWQSVDRTKTCLTGAEDKS